MQIKKIKIPHTLPKHYPRWAIVSKNTEKSERFLFLEKIAILCFSDRRPQFRHVSEHLTKKISQKLNTKYFIKQKALPQRTDNLSSFYTNSFALVTMPNILQIFQIWQFNRHTKNMLMFESKNRPLLHGLWYCDFYTSKVLYLVLSKQQ